MRDGGYVYGRGSVDDKDNVVAGLMIMLLLKRQNVPLDRDVYDDLVLLGHKLGVSQSLQPVAI